MKKVSILVSVFLLIFAINIFAANDTVKVLINDKYITFADQNGNVVNPEIANDRTMVPLRRIFEEIGAEIEWENSTKTVTAIKDGKTVILTIGNTQAYTIENGVKKEMTLDSKPYIVEGRTLVPLRFISESFDSLVGWDSDSRTAIIVKTDKFKEKFKSDCSNFIEYINTVKNPEKNMKFLGTTKFEGKRESVKEALEKIKDSNKFNVIVNEYEVYFNLPEVASSISNNNEGLTKTYISINLKDIIGEDKKIDDIIFLINEYNEEVTLDTYNQLKKLYESVSQLLCNNNFKILKDQSKTTYMFSLKDYEYYDYRLDMTMLISIDVTIPTTSDVMESMNMNVKVAPKGQDKYALISLDGNIEYSSTQYAIPDDEEVVDLFELISQIIIIQAMSKNINSITIN